MIPLHAEVYLVTALVPSETACLASSPGRRSFTAVWTSLDERVCFLLYLTSLEDSVAIFSKMSQMKEFMMLMDLFEIPTSGWTCLSTLQIQTEKDSTLFFLCLVTVGFFALGVFFPASLAAILFICFNYDYKLQLPYIVRNFKIEKIDFKLSFDWLKS